MKKVLAIAMVLGLLGATSASAALITSKYRQEVLALNPVGYYQLDELATGPFANTGSGSPTVGTNTGTPTGGSASAYAPLGTAVDFDRSDTKEAINVGNVITTSDTDAATIAFWFNASDVTANYNLLVKGTDSGSTSARSIVLRTRSGSLQAITSVGAFNLVTLSAPVSVDQWYFVTYVRNGAGTGGPNRDAILYLDGVYVDETNNSTLGTSNPNHDIYIGTDPGRTRSPLAVIDEVAFFQTALTGSQIQALYDAGPLTVSGPEDPPPGGDAIPEPATLALLGLGTLGLVIRRR